MARIQVEDLPRGFAVDETLRLKPRIREVVEDGVTVLVDPVGGGWLGLAGAAAGILESLRNGTQAWWLVRQHGSFVAPALENLASQGLLEGRELPQAVHAAKGACAGIRFSVTLTTRCNLACIYCAQAAGVSGTTMSRRVLYRVMDTIFSVPKADGYDIHFGGGETLLEFELLKSGVRYARRHAPSEVRFSIQTNGTTIDQTRARWLAEERFHVGVSLDGMDVVQNRHRPFSDGSPSYAQTMAGIARLHGAGVRIYPLATLMEPDEFDALFDFMISHELHAFLVRAASFGGRNRTPLTANQQEQIAKAHLGLFDRILDHLEATGERLHEERSACVLKALLAPPGSAVCIEPCVAGRGIIAFTPDGSFYPCDRFVDSIEMRVGHVSERQPLLAAVERSPVVARLAQRNYQVVARCRACTFRLYCQGSCSAASYYRFGDLRRESDQCVHDRTFLLGMMARASKRPELVSRYYRAVQAGPHPGT